MVKKKTKKKTYPKIVTDEIIEKALDADVLEKRITLEMRLETLESRFNALLVAIDKCKRVKGI